MGRNDHPRLSSRPTLCIQLHIGQAAISEHRNNYTAKQNKTKKKNDKSRKLWFKKKKKKKKLPIALCTAPFHPARRRLQLPRKPPWWSLSKETKPKMGSWRSFHFFRSFCDFGVGAHRFPFWKRSSLPWFLCFLASMGCGMSIFLRSRFFNCTYLVSHFVVCLFVFSFPVTV